jgi:large subunit ribosomal protein L15
MKLHELAPAKGAHVERVRVGRGIAAGKGKTAGRGTKGQKSRAGGSLPAWFEGGQTPLHQRIPKLRGFRNRSRVEYETVNVGRIAEAAAAGRLPSGELPGARKSAKPAPVTANAELLRAAGLVRHVGRPLKILGGGDVELPLAVIADAFTASAVAKIEAAGGRATRLEVPAPARPDRPERPDRPKRASRPADDDARAAEAGGTPSTLEAEEPIDAADGAEPTADTDATAEAEVAQVEADAAQADSDWAGQADPSPDTDTDTDADA